MTPLKQTLFSDEKKGVIGNCLQACVASLLDLPLEEIPHFTWYMSEWANRLYIFLDGRGYKFNGTRNIKHDGVSWLKDFKGIDGYIIVGGGSPRGIWNGHAVIYKDGEPFFDPHPDNTFLTSEEDVYVIEKLNQ
jgi:hypothetical protein